MSRDREVCDSPCRLPWARFHEREIGCTTMLLPALNALALGVTVPPYWYALAAVLILTPVYFLLSRPRKKRADSKWKG